MKPSSVLVPEPTRLPPTVRFLAIPAPPATVRAPVAADVDSVVAETSTVTASMVLLLRVSAPARVASVPVVGRVTEVAPCIVKATLPPVRVRVKP